MFTWFTHMHFYQNTEPWRHCCWRQTASGLPLVPGLLWWRLCENERELLCRRSSPDCDCKKQSAHRSLINKKKNQKDVFECAHLLEKDSVIEEQRTKPPRIQRMPPAHPIKRAAPSSYLKPQNYLKPSDLNPSRKLQMMPHTLLIYNERVEKLWCYAVCIEGARSYRAETWKEQQIWLHLTNYNIFEKAAASLIVPTYHQEQNWSQQNKWFWFCFGHFLQFLYISSPQVQTHTQKSPSRRPQSSILCTLGCSLQNRKPLFCKWKTLLPLFGIFIAKIYPLQHL